MYRFLIISLLVGMPGSLINTAWSQSDSLWYSRVVTRVRGDFGFLEGPCYGPGGKLYFSDLRQRTIYCYDDSSGISVFMDQLPGCNGLMFYGDHTLMVCETGGGREVSAIDTRTLTRTPVAMYYKGRRFNSPNDLWVDHRGGFYFTDPRYGSRDNMELDTEQVYYTASGWKRIVRVTGDLVRPNGVIGTPDGNWLYIADYADNSVFRYKIKKNGTLRRKTLFAEAGQVDGMTLDEKGNLYLCSDRVLVYSPDGNRILDIEVPERPSNACFGGPQGKTLYITAQTSLYRIRMNVHGAF